MSTLNFLNSPLDLVVAAVVLFSVYAVSSYVKLRQFPGPLLLAVSNLPHAKAMLGDNVHLWYADLAERYGKVVRVAPNVLLTSSIELWTHVQKDKRYKRSDWVYRAFRSEHRRDNVFTQTDNAKHDERRKQMMPGYSGRENLDLEPSIDEIVVDMVHLLRSKYLSSEHRATPVDLAVKCQYFTLDVISRVGFGEKFGMLTTDSDVNDYVKSALVGFHVFRFVLGSGLRHIVQAPIIGRFLAATPADQNGFGKMMAFAFKKLDERAASSNPAEERADMISSFMRNGVVGDDLRSEVIEQVIAGSDSSASGIRAIILHVITNPQVYAKLQREIDETTVHKGEIISFEKARSLKYLQAVIRESLRMFPPVTAFFSRDIPPGGDEVSLGNGETVYLPGGTSIGPAIVNFHHDSETYGEDAKVFRPERWFESDPDKLERMKDVSRLMFGYGQFQCLGKPVAQIEMSKLIFELFWNFDISIVNSQKPWDAKCFMGLFSIRDMWVQVRDRR